MAHKRPDLIADLTSWRQKNILASKFIQSCFNDGRLISAVAKNLILNILTDSIIVPFNASRVRQHRFTTENPISCSTKRSSLTAAFSSRVPPKRQIFVGRKN